ncbi:winged helix-turn-helix domain-containing protein [Burkholderia sp. GbtcB21]|uniref:winged helix-turn-helix domain-containing protein n=1 Tax=Burkholderia sp. GbtcB21 TaxID=2824766 RepID=UPI0034D3993D
MPRDAHLCRTVNAVHSARYDRAIDVQILRLRRKLEVDPTKPTLLRTKRGVGYFLDAETDPLWS